MAGQLAPSGAADDFDRIAGFAQQFAGADPSDVLRWARSRYAPELAIVSNYGPGTLVAIHLMAEIDATVPVIHLNTGFEFPETEAVGERLRERYGVEIIEVVPELTVDQQAEKYGRDLFRTDADFCCHMRKVEPLANALSGYRAWVTGIRRTQSETRQDARIVEWDLRHDMVKVNPLAEWSRDDVWAFIRKHGIPYNELHDRGYASIGCTHCTRPVTEGEDERSGRWSGTAKRECGIHMAHFAPTSRAQVRQRHTA